MQYKIGDKVKIKKYIGLSEKAGVYINNQRGEVGTVINIHSHLLRIKPDNCQMIGKFWWHVEDVEVVEDEQKED